KGNTAILELTRHGGRPVHIDLPTTYSLPFTEKETLRTRVIQRFTLTDNLPELKTDKRIAVFDGSHKPWSAEETKALEDFCDRYDAVVFCDHTSGYQGKGRLLFSLAAAQELHTKAELKPDITLHIGEITGDYPLLGMAEREVSRISADGEIRDTFRRLRYVFEMSETSFFRRYAGESGGATKKSYYQQCAEFLETVRKKIPEIPFSNIWLASKMASKIPPGSVIHFGILNSLRTWNFFELPDNVASFSNVGGFGIDGGVSTLLGASLGNPNKLYYGVIGDLAFFYDLNAIGNRHTPNNLRVLLVNNGKGIEFRLYNHHAAHFGSDGDELVAAAGHYGNKSRSLVKNFAESLGFEYFSASNKEALETADQRFIGPRVTVGRLLSEVSTDGEEESRALRLMHPLEVSPEGKGNLLVRSVLGQRGVNTVKEMVTRW